MSWWKSPPKFYDTVRPEVRKMWAALPPGPVTRQQRRHAERKAKKRAIRRARGIDPR